MLLLSNISVIYFVLMYVLAMKYETMSPNLETLNPFIQNLHWFFFLFAGIVCVLEFTIYLPQIQKRKDNSRKGFMILSIANASSIAIFGLIYGILYVIETGHMPWLVVSFFFGLSLVLGNYIYFTKIRPIIGQKTL